MNTKYKTFDQLTDSEKQTIASAYIDTQTVYLQNDVVEYILQKSWEDREAPFCYDDITNNAPTGEIELSSGWAELNEKERDELLEALEDSKYENLQDDIEALENMEFENYPEIFQWFLCSDHLIYALEKAGECTLNDTYWGRQCCGQSIILDHVIQTIAYETYTQTHWPKSEELKKILGA